MKSLPANCPVWLEQKILEKGGAISFYDFMNSVLNDPVNGYYGSGKANIGFKGDFVTSPSLSDDFSYLLSKQIEDWLLQISSKNNLKQKLTILEFGAGDASLLKGIIKYFLDKNKTILKNISFKICELNQGMKEKQKNLLQNYLEQNIDIQWINIEEFQKNNINGIVLAHEVLDAFPVERIQFSEGVLSKQIVELDINKKLILNKIPLPEKLIKRIDFLKNNLKISIPPANAPDGWTNELHMDNYLWLKNIYDRLNKGILLIIDYSIDAKRYYSATKSDGNIVAYHNQKVINDILSNPGNIDLTSHLCNEILIADAKKAGFKFNGMIKQGEALLSLGLAKMIYDIQRKYKDDLSEALLRREALLRLVDPICLGNFKWFIFQKNFKKNVDIKSKFIN